MKVLNFYLLRHGKTLGQSALNGRTDVGVDLAVQHRIRDRMVEKELPITHIVSSPLQRCAQVATLLHERLDNVPLNLDAAFQEMDFGDYDGVAFEKLDDKWQELEAFWYDPADRPLPNGESLAEFHQRVTQAWDKLVDTAHGDTLLICHGGTIRIILAHILNLDWKNPAWYSQLNIANQSLSHVQISVTDSRFASVKTIGEVL
ncbi:histidine phosphatase family protein [Vibrio sp. V39_P1S14PM300]|uniref:histidine phosphatase family protein n=1 Tax=Vibrio sp. V39_P1S14PM300 TaxID=1938690 RepID=UPI00137357A9|nr:histidine phosphatase family protein [Vibrio sp. V39_P1S14PM300]NAX22603.1 alpha-ribazole phosphatase [Vibrio sp. V39_P1S14PM300]